MNQDVPSRQTIITWLYSFFPYLQAEILTEADFSSEDLQGFCIVAQYPGYEQDATYIRLKNRNDEAMKREEAALAASKNKNNTKNDYYSNIYSNQYPQYPQYQNYDPYYTNQYQYGGYNYDPSYQPQQTPYYDYSSAQQSNYGNNYNQGSNDRYSQGKNNYSQYGGPYQQTNTQAVPEPEAPKPVEVKPTPAERSPVVQKETEKQTAPSTPAQVLVEKKQEVEPKKEAAKLPLIFADLKKLVIDFKDYSAVPQAFKDRIEEVNKREPVYEELKINYKKNNRYQNQNQNQNQNKQTTETLSRSTATPDTSKSEPLVCKIIRKEENEEEKKVKDELKKSSLGGGIGLKIKGMELTEAQKAEKEIKFNLNLITLQNFINIKQELIPYVIENEKYCEILINLMIEKAWIEPKFAIIYAKLSSDFGKLNNFKWGEKKDKSEDKKKGSNPFKTVLIKVVQEFFEDDFTLKEKNQVIKEENQEKEQVAPQLEDTKMIKKKIIGNVRFIGELLLQKVLSRKIVYYCIGHLLECFFKHYSKASIKHSNELAEIYFEALIELVEKVGDKFENKEDKLTDKQFQDLHKLIDSAAKNAVPLVGVDSEKWLLSTDRFFDIFHAIDVQVLMGKYPRISALLKNLTERKENNWISHVVENKGPMTLDDARREEEARVEYEKTSTKPAFDFEKEWGKIFAKYDKGRYLKEDTIDEYIEYKDENAKDDLKKLVKLDAYEIVSAYVRIFADGTRPVVERRVNLFQIILDMGFIKYDHLRQGWLKNANKLCYSDFPLAAAYFPKIMLMMNAKNAIHLPDWEIKNTEDEEEVQYANDVLERYKKEIKK